MKLLLDQGVTKALFVPGAVVSLGAWLNLFPVHPLAVPLAVGAMVLGGAGLLLQEFLR